MTLKSTEGQSNHSIADEVGRSLSDGKWKPAEIFMKARPARVFSVERVQSHAHEAMTLNFHNHGRPGSRVS